MQKQAFFLTQQLKYVILSPYIDIFPPKTVQHAFFVSPFIYLLVQCKISPISPYKNALPSFSYHIDTLLCYQ